MIFVYGPVWLVLGIVVLVLLSDRQTPEERRPVNNWDYLKAGGVVTASLAAFSCPLLSFGSDPLLSPTAATVVLLISVIGGLTAAVYGAVRAKRLHLARRSMFIRPKNPAKPRDPMLGSWKDRA